ncbi:MAG TPA: hypothetical protein VEM96_11390 [Pyrinomonadaceae bacterium]|nr:hypothetical protein [Pyrinomonadaceae bacterium]
MLQQYAAGFYQLGLNLGVLEVAAQKGESAIVGRLRGQAHENLKQVLEVARTWCVATGLESSIKGIDYVLTLPARELKYRALKGIFGELKRRIEEELATVFLMHVPPSRIGYYEDAPQFGAAVAAKYPEATNDIQEAGKCLALCRHTSSVFHLMRAMEFGVQSLGRRLNVPIPVEEKDWGTISSHINGALKRLPKSTTAERADYQAYATAAVYLDNVRVAWRNPTMHPKETYSEEEAVRIFGFAKQFMQHLADLI